MIILQLFPIVLLRVFCRNLHYDCDQIYFLLMHTEDEKYNKIMLLFYVDSANTILRLYRPFIFLTDMCIALQYFHDVLQFFKRSILIFMIVVTRDLL